MVIFPGNRHQRNILMYEENFTICIYQHL